MCWSNIPDSAYLHEVRNTKKTDDRYYEEKKRNAYLHQAPLQLEVEKNKHLLDKSQTSTFSKSSSANRITFVPFRSSVFSLYCSGLARRGKNIHLRNKSLQPADS